MKNSPSRITLTVDTELKASHALEGFEIPHFHLWKISVSFSAALPLANDRLIDLMFLQTTLDKILAPHQNAFLNETFPKSPTSENVALWIWEQVSTTLPYAPLHAVDVRLCDLEGNSTGVARVGL